MHRKGRSETATSHPDQQGQRVLSDVIPRAGADSVNGGDVEYVEWREVRFVELSQNPKTSKNYFSQSNDAIGKFRVSNSL